MLHSTLKHYYNVLLLCLIAKLSDLNSPIFKFSRKFPTYSYATTQLQFKSSHRAHIKTSAISIQWTVNENT